MNVDSKSYLSILKGTILSVLVLKFPVTVSCTPFSKSKYMELGPLDLPH